MLDQSYMVYSFKGQLPVCSDLPVSSKNVTMNAFLFHDLRWNIFHLIVGRKHKADDA